MLPAAARATPAGDSFEGAKSWVKELQRRGDPAVVIALAGNKADVREGRAVPADEAKAYAADAGIICMDTSAKTGLNVKEVFVQIGARRRVGGRGMRAGACRRNRRPAAAPLCCAQRKSCQEAPRAAKRTPSQTSPRQSPPRRPQAAAAAEAGTLSLRPLRRPPSTRSRAHARAIVHAPPPLASSCALNTALT